MKSRIRIRFCKSGDLRFISHHDLMKLFERAIRRANISIEMSKGFNPHPKLSIPLALSVGIPGKDEVLELELLKSMPPENLVEQLSLQLPKEIHILSGELIADTEKSRICNVLYEVLFKDPGCLNMAKVNTLLQQSSVVIIRSKNGHQKPFDIRPSIQEITVKPDRLFISIRVKNEGMAKPEEVVYSLLGNGGKESFQITRIKVNYSSA